MKNTLIIGIVCMLSISLISASSLMNEDYNNDVSTVTAYLFNGLSYIYNSYLIDGNYKSSDKSSGDDSLNTSVNNTSNVSEVTVNVSDIISASKQVKSYEDENGSLPVNVEISGENYTNEQFLYMLSKIITNVNSSNNSSSIQVLKDIGPAFSKGNNSAGELDRKAYVNASASIIAFVNSTKQAPNFLMSEKLGNMSFNKTVDGFVRAVNYMADNNNTLPETLSFEAEYPVAENFAQSSNDGSYSVPTSSNSYSSKEWGLVNSLRSQLSGKTYGPDGDCYTFSQLVYNALSAAGYQCGIYHGHTELGNHRVPYVYIDGKRYWLETCRVVHNGWASGTTDWTIPYSSWTPEYILVSS